MKSHMPIGVLCLVLLTAALLAGCHQSSTAQDPATDPKRGDINGYYEFHREGALYVVGTMSSMDAVQAGKMLPKSLRMFTSLGEQMIVEADDGGLQYRLLAEYQRRHPTTGQGVTVK